MSNEQLNLRLTAQDDASGKVKKFERSIKGAGDQAKGSSLSFGKMAGAVALGTVAVAAAGKALKAVTDFLGDSVDAAAETEKQWNLTTAALERHGLATEANIDKVKQFADTMQTLTGVADEEYGRAVGRLVDAGLDLEQSFVAVEAAADIAAATGKDTAGILGKISDAIIKEDVIALEKWTGAIDTSLPFAEQLNQSLQNIDDRFGGAAADNADTYSNRINVLGQKFGDLQEKIGTLLLPTLLKLANTFITITDALNGLFSSSLDNFKAFEATSEAAKKQRGELNKLVVRYDVLKKKTKLSKDEQAELSKIIKAIRKDMPGITTEFTEYGEAISISSGEVTTLTEAEQELSEIYAERELKTLIEELAELEQELKDNTKETKEFQDAFDATSQGFKDSYLSKSAKTDLEDLKIAGNELTISIGEIKKKLDGLAGVGSIVIPISLELDDDILQEDITKVIGVDKFADVGKAAAKEFALTFKQTMAVQQVGKTFIKDIFGSAVEDDGSIKSKTAKIIQNIAEAAQTELSIVKSKSKESVAIQKKANEDTFNAVQAGLLSELLLNEAAGNEVLALRISNRMDINTITNDLGLLGLASEAEILEAEKLMVETALIERHELEASLRQEHFDNLAEIATGGFGSLNALGVEFSTKTFDNFMKFKSGIDSITKGIAGLTKGTSKLNSIWTAGKGIVEGVTSGLGKFASTMAAATAKVWAFVSALVAEAAQLVVTTGKAIASAAVSAAKAVAGIPFVGPALAIAAASAIIVGLGSLIGGFDDPANDAVARRWGIDAGNNFMLGFQSVTSAPGFGQQVVGSLRGNGATGGSSGGAVTIEQNITIEGGAGTTQEFVETVIAPAIEDAAADGITRIMTAAPRITGGPSESFGSIRDKVVITNPVRTFTRSRSTF